MPPKTVAQTPKNQPKSVDKKQWRAEDYVTLTIPIE